MASFRSTRKTLWPETCQSIQNKPKYIILKDIKIFKLSGISSKRPPFSTQAGTGHFFDLRSDKAKRMNSQTVIAEYSN
jgi:hypothetical protein